MMDVDKINSYVNRAQLSINDWNAVMRLITSGRHKPTLARRWSWKERLASLPWRPKRRDLQRR